MKTTSSSSVVTPEVVGMRPSSPLGEARMGQPVERDHSEKVERYRTACKAAADLAAARTKCRDVIDLALEEKPNGAAALAQAMMEVGAAASRDLGDPSSTAFLLGHLSRRIREGTYIDF